MKRNWNLTNRKRYIEKRKLRELEEWSFILNAAKNGDMSAIKIYNRYVEIDKEIDLLKKEYKETIPAFKSIVIDSIYSLHKEKKSLLFDFDLQSKKAKIYLDTLKRKRKNHEDD